MPEHTNRTFICSVLFPDIGYSRRMSAEQFTLKERFDSVLTEAIAGVATRLFRHQDAKTDPLP